MVTAEAPVIIEDITTTPKARRAAKGVENPKREATHHHAHLEELNALPASVQHTAKSTTPSPGQAKCASAVGNLMVAATPNTNAPASMLAHASA